MFWLRGCGLGLLGGGLFWMLGLGLLKLLFWAGLIALIVMAVRSRRYHWAHLAPQSPLDILNARYARGEIGKEQYDDMRKTIQG